MVWSSMSKIGCILSVLALHLRRSRLPLYLHEQGKFSNDWMHFRQWVGPFQFYILSKNKEMIQKPFAISSNCKVLLPMECWKNTKRANGSTHRCYVKGSDAINPLAQNKSHKSYFYFRFFFPVQALCYKRCYATPDTWRFSLLSDLATTVSLSLCFCM